MILIQIRNGTPSEIKLQKVIVIFFASRKQREKVLIFSLLRDSASFGNFEFLPSVGASRGILTVWKSHLFHGHLVFSNDFCLPVDFTSKHNDSTCVLTNIYAKCTPPGKQILLQWLKNIQMPSEVNWLLEGDFNLIRKPENKNRPGGDITEILHFNEALSALG